MPSPPSRRRRAQIAISVLALAACLPLGHAALSRGLRGREWFELVVRALYAAPAPAPAAHSGKARLSLALDRRAGSVDPRFVSVALDTAQLVGGRFWSPTGEVEALRGKARRPALDLTQPRLRTLARQLAPAYLRVGGTEADFVRYDLGQRAATMSGKTESVLTAARWDALHDFTQRTGLELFFTVNAGRADREAGAFTGRQTEALLRHAAGREHHVGVWELGNEVNAFWLTLGPLAHVSATQYARDVHVFERLVHRYYPRSRVAAGAAFVWPVMGEPAPRLLPELTRLAGDDLDVITWHYYPQQSRRCLLASRRAHPGQLLGPPALDEVDRWARYVTGLRDRHAPRAETWLGETGGAQCGGEPGDSDRFASSLWWLDELGSAARAGQRVVVRQTLTGSNYGLLDEATLEPRPDYVATLLWKQTMGEAVLSVSAQGDPRLRAYAHCTPHAPGSVSLLALNVDAHDPLSVQLPDWARGPAQRYLVEAESPGAAAVSVNGAAPQPTPEGLQLPAADPWFSRAGELRLNPASYAFLVFPEARAPACL